MDARGFVKSQFYPFIWYKEEMVLIFYVDYFLIFSPSKDKIDGVYASIWEDLKMKDFGELNKYLGI